MKNETKGKLKARQAAVWAACLALPAAGLGTLTYLTTTEDYRNFSLCLLPMVSVLAIASGTLASLKTKSMGQEFKLGFNENNEISSLKFLETKYPDVGPKEMPWPEFEYGSPVDVKLEDTERLSDEFRKIMLENLPEK